MLIAILYIIAGVPAVVFVALVTFAAIIYISNGRFTRDCMRIPDLEPMYEAVVDFVKAHQGVKGFINTSAPGHDIIHAQDYDWDGLLVESFVAAIRVRYNELEIMLQENHKPLSDDEISQATGDPLWVSVKNGDILFVSTIYSIAEAVRQYA